MSYNQLNLYFIRVLSASSTRQAAIHPRPNEKNQQNMTRKPQKNPICQWTFSFPTVQTFPCIFLPPYPEILSAHTLECNCRNSNASVNSSSFCSSISSAKIDRAKTEGWRERRWFLTLLCKVSAVSFSLNFQDGYLGFRKHDSAVTGLKLSLKSLKIKVFSPVIKTDE